jgi:[ribosomal protein S5]-alanine N-acetyltransferase
MTMDPHSPEPPSKPPACGWEGEKVRLVSLDKTAHFANCVRWLNDPAVTRWTLLGDLPLTRIAEEQFFERVCHPGPEPHELVLAIETRGEVAEHVGVTGLHAIEWRHGVAQTGLIIGRSQLWSRGLGGDAMRVRTRYAFEVLGLRLLLSQVFAENAASLRALAKVGYREVGRIPQRYWKRGAWRDLVLLALPRAEWRP